MASIGTLQSQNPQPNSIRPRWKAMAARRPRRVFGPPARMSRLTASSKAASSSPSNAAWGMKTDSHACSTRGMNAVSAKCR
jgi:hypothetical protein